MFTRLPKPVGVAFLGKVGVALRAGACVVSAGVVVAPVSPATSWGLWGSRGRRRGRWSRGAGRSRRTPCNCKVEAADESFRRIDTRWLHKTSRPKGMDNCFELVQNEGLRLAANVVHIVARAASLPDLSLSL